MPYGDLAAQRVQRFATLDDLDQHHCTIEEREEYAPHVEQGTVVYAGVDYQAILRAAETEADVLVWDGGNNDLPFLRPDVHMCLVDPHRPGHETLYYPGTANLRMADFVVIPKEDTADPDHISQVKAAVQRHNPRAIIIDAAAPLHVSDPALIAGKRVLVIEDGPTLTHGGMTYGAGTIAAKRWGAAELVDPRPYACGSIAATLETYPALQRLLPAMGYGASQIAELEATINATPCDTVIFGTPVDLRRLLTLHVPAVRVSYDIEEIGEPTLAALVPCLAQRTRDAALLITHAYDRRDNPCTHDHARWLWHRFSCILTLFLYGQVVAEDSAPRGSIQTTMHEFFQALTSVFPWSLDAQQFQAPEQRQRIQAALRALAQHAEQLDTHGQDVPQSFGFLRRSLARSAHDAAERYAQGAVSAGPVPAPGTHRELLCVSLAAPESPAVCARPALPRGDQCREPPRPTTPQAGGGDPAV